MKTKFISTTLILAKEITIIMTIYLLGEATVTLLDIDFPGSIIGMLYLLLALYKKWLKLEDIRRLSTFLLGYMPLFFIPAGVSIMNSYTLMEGHYIKIVLIVIASTFVAMTATALFLQLLANRRES